MDALQKNIAVTRGEALAANIMATAAIQAIFMILERKQETLTAMSAFIEDTLNRAGPAKGDADNEFNTLMRETARFQTMQYIDSIAQMIRKMPKD